MRVTGIDHVQIAIPGGGEDLARAFYGGLLGLREVAKPAPLAERGGCWFSGLGIAVHLGVDREFRPATKAHVAILVDDLPAARGVLEGAGVAIVDDDVDIGVRRFYVADPFGNRLEVVAAADVGFTERPR